MTLPSPVLDRVVIDVRDRIDEAMRCFASFGFLLTPRGRHTLGSVNHLAMFATDYLELLGSVEDGATRTEIARFPAGFNGLVFKTADAAAVHREAEAAGLPVLPAQAFSRPVALSGTTRDARFRPPGSIRPRSQWAASISASINRGGLSTGDHGRCSESA